MHLQQLRFTAWSGMTEYKDTDGYTLMLAYNSAPRLLKNLVEGTSESFTVDLLIIESGSHELVVYYKEQRALANMQESINALRKQVAELKNESEE